MPLGGAVGPEAAQQGWLLLWTTASVLLETTSRYSCGRLTTPRCSGMLETPELEEEARLHPTYGSSLDLLHRASVPETLWAVDSGVIQRASNGEAQAANDGGSYDGSQCPGQESPARSGCAQVSGGFAPP